MLRLTHEDIARTLDLEMADGSTVGAAVRIFAEGGLVETGTDDDGRFIRFLEVPGKVDLTQTDALCGRRGGARELRSTFAGSRSGRRPDPRAIINRPIYPDRVPFLN